VIEVELKARLTDFEAASAAVEAAGARPEGSVVKRDVYYGPEGKSAAEIDFARDRIFRIRVEGPHCLVTAKRRALTPEGTEVNQEIELSIGDPVSLDALARYLGFRPFIEKRKETRKYALEGAAVELHRIDPIGDFIEIEALVEREEEVPAANARVRALLARFGVPESAVEPRLYIDLLREAGAGSPTP
jgi:adenylate cyclase class 2